MFKLFLMKRCFCGLNKITNISSLMKKKYLKEIRAGDLEQSETLQ